MLCKRWFICFNSLVFFAIIFVLCTSAVEATPILYVHDGSNRLATVDVKTADISILGNMGITMTDIGFDPNGNLYGISFNNLYSIDPDTATTSFIGNHGIPGANALVFDRDGTLYGAGFATTSLYTIDPRTGLSNNIGDIGFSSSGDLAFHGNELFLSSKTNELVRIDLSDNGSGTAVGEFGFYSVYGLARGDDDILYGVSGSSIFSVDTATGKGTLVSNYNCFGDAYGTSFYSEAGASYETPEPNSLVLLALGLIITLFAIRKRL